MSQRPFPTPMTPMRDERAVLLDYLDFFRAVAQSKVEGLSARDRATSRLPSGWTPLELLNHLRYVERRWLEWGFAGVPVPDPWGDQQAGRWCTTEDFDTLTAHLDEQASVTRRIVERHRLDDVGVPGERWEGQAPASLRRVLLHLVQEYARHCGHLDVVRELADGTTGEEPS